MPALSLVERQSHSVSVHGRPHEQVPVSSERFVRYSFFISDKRSQALGTGPARQSPGTQPQVHGLNGPEVVGCWARSDSMNESPRWKCQQNHRQNQGASPDPHAARTPKQPKSEGQNLEANCYNCEDNQECACQQPPCGTSCSRLVDLAPVETSPAVAIAGDKDWHFKPAFGSQVVEEVSNDGRNKSGQCCKHQPSSWAAVARCQARSHADRGEDSHLPRIDRS